MHTLSLLLSFYVTVDVIVCVKNPSRLQQIVVFPAVEAALSYSKLIPRHELSAACRTLKTVYVVHLLLRPHHKVYSLECQTTFGTWCSEQPTNKSAYLYFLGCIKYYASHFIH